MKKIFGRLLIFSIAAAVLSGCDLFESLGGGSESALDAEKEVKGLDLRDYRTAAVKNSKYEFGGKAFILYEDGTEVDATDKCVYPVLDTSELGPKEYKVKYEGEKFIYPKTVTIQIVEHIDLESIAVLEYSKTAQLESDFVFDGKVIATYIDGSTKDVTDSISYNDLNTSNVGKQNLKITYAEDNIVKDVTVTISIIDSLPKLTKIEAIDYTDSIHNGKEYVFDGKVIATYEDGSTKDVTEKATVSKVDTTLSGEQEFVVTYTERKETKLFSGKVSVTRDLVGLELSGFKTIYSLNGTFSLDGKVYAKYDDGTKEEVTSKTIIDSSNVDMTNEGAYTIDFKYQENGITRSATLEVEVAVYVPKVTSIQASDYKSTVDVNGIYTFDGVVTATYEDGTTANVTSECTFSTISTTSSGYKTLTITHTDPHYGTSKKITVSIEVIARVTNLLVSSTLEVGINKTKQLNVEVVPSTAKNKNLHFESDNLSVATVDSDGKVKGVGEGTATITITADDNASISKTVTVAVSETSNDAWTIMLYISGADLESEGSYATDDIKEILSVAGQPDDVNIILQTGGSTSWHTSGISASYNQRFRIENKKLVSAYKYSESDQTNKVYSSYQSMGKASTLRDYLIWGIENYPAEKMGLILWNHGGGLDGVCYDDKASSQDSLKNYEVLQATQEAFTQTGRTDKFEFIGYDACLMQMMEIADFNSPYYNYQVASQESEAGSGWDYDTWVDDLYAGKSSPVVFKAIVDGFIVDNGGANSYNNQTLSYLDLSKMDAFKSAWEEMASATRNKVSSTNKSDFQDNVIGETKYFSSKSYGYDAYNFLEKLEASSTFNPGGSYVKNAKDALKALVGYNLAQKGSADAHGVSCYMGDDATNSSTYTHFTNWSNLIDYVGGYPSGWSWW